MYLFKQYLFLFKQIAILQQYFLPRDKREGSSVSSQVQSLVLYIPAYSILPYIQIYIYIWDAR